jgi:hypothetical protein
MNHEAEGLTLGRWASSEGAPEGAPVFLFDRGDPPSDLAGARIVLPQGGLSRGEELLAAGAEQVLFADAALLDSTLIESAAGRFGSGKVGVWLPLRRMGVSWSLDCFSNADFKCLTPSLAVPTWEVLKSDFSPTGTEAGWWIGQMLALGASTVVISKDLEDERDLDICADMVERFGASLWFSPLAEPQADPAPWVRFGKVRRLILPEGRCGEEALQALRDVLMGAGEAGA